MFVNPTSAVFLGLFTAQTPGIPADTWERLGFSGLGIAATIYLWRFFSAKDAAAQAKRDKDEKDFRDQVIKDADRERTERLERERLDSEERNRLLTENNRLQQAVIDLNREQIALQENFNGKLLQTQRDFLKAHEDGQRSIKDILRKVRCPGAGTIE